MTPTRRATMRDVAQAAGVSQQTVSRVLTSPDLVAPETRSRVLGAIDELRYVPHEAARRLQSARHPGSARGGMIGVLAHQLTATGPAGITTAAMQELQASGYSLDVVYLHDDDRDAITSVMRRFSTSTVGVLAMAQTEDARQAVLSVDLPVPLYIDEGLDRGTVELPGNEELIGTAAAEHLHQHEHVSVIHITGPRGSLAAMYRADAFRDACATRRMEVRCTSAGDWTEQSGAAAIEQMEIRDATAVFAANDAMAIGALDALARRGVRVPEDVSVLGADDIPAAAFVTPSLSSVAHDLDEQGRHAARTLLTALGADPAPVTDPTFGVSVRQRASTAGTATPPT
ncbi:hypothetical protein C5C13_11605 [Clavibacter michiganensis]|nr:hypothetical protein C5C13_11605 [Clavibacter michiganensis]